MINSIFIWICNFLGQVMEFLYPFREYILFVLGALISAVIGYWFSRHRERIILKMSIQISTVDKMFQLFDDFGKKSSYFTSFMHFNFGRYNDLINSTTLTHETKVSYISTQRQDLINKCTEFTSLYLSYGEAISQIILMMESREVVLSKFIPLRTNLHKYAGEISNQFQKVADMSYNDTFGITVLGLPIEDDYIRKIQNEQVELVRLCVDVIATVKDIEIKMQNEFLSDLFNYEVPERVELSNQEVTK